MEWGICLLLLGDWLEDNGNTNREHWRVLSFLVKILDEMRPGLGNGTRLLLKKQFLDKCCRMPLGSLTKALQLGPA